MQDPELDPASVEKEYSQLIYVINRCLSYFPETLLHAQQMNMRSKLDAKPQYVYYLSAIPKGKRFEKGIKPEKSDDLALVKRYFNYNTKKARKALEILTDSNLEYIRARLYEGGIAKKSK